MESISAAKILAGAKKAQPFNITKLADYTVYDRVPYSDFKAAIIGHEKESEINSLLSMVALMSKDQSNKEEKIYTFFILSLSEILLEA